MSMTGNYLEFLLVPIDFMDCAWESRVGLWVLSASAFDPTIIPPCHQQAFGPSITRITFPAKECASFFSVLCCRSCCC